MNDLIDRQALMAKLEREVAFADNLETAREIANIVKYFPSAEHECLTDVEKRIFLAAMCREKEVCERTDKECPGDVKFVRVCKEIERKVKKALWETRLTETKH